ncbi:hypothetical protein J0S82_018108 [Galemys pyrenaicus]|uniref:Uncharacterized protein n=1 Tax=Galemys pyrenaicus TaxID=202257 RepID=A0A8J6AZE5_GALPY|nr:hypothetical protein J0S82_018108 [Galemys pyrenaicus]
MNFDQKAVKFLASFHIDRDRPRAHGPPRQGPLARRTRSSGRAGPGSRLERLCLRLLQMQGQPGAGARPGRRAAPGGADAVGRSQPLEEDGPHTGPQLLPRPEPAGAE